MSKAKVALGGFAAVAALATPVIMKWEGNHPVGYVDLVGVKTRCWGNTSPGIVVGKRYSDAECRALLTRDVEQHAAKIRPCVPASTPIESQAAFLSLAFNVGPGGICNSTLGRKLRAGDLAGACAELSRWNKARVNGKLVVVRGLTNRRADERRLCERGL